MNKELEQRAIKMIVEKKAAGFFKFMRHHDDDAVAIDKAWQRALSFAEDELENDIYLYEMGLKNGK